MRSIIDRALLVCLLAGAPVAVMMATLGNWVLQILLVRGAFDLPSAEARAAISAVFPDRFRHPAPRIVGGQIHCMRRFGE